MPWLRLWDDLLDSDKIAELDDSTYRGWTMLLLAAKRLDQDGLLPPVKRISFWVRRSEAEVMAWIETLHAAELLDARSGWYRVHDWRKWQPPRDKTAAKRQSAWRERQKGSLHPPKTEEIQEQSRAEQRETPPPVTDVTAPKTDRNGVTPPEITVVTHESDTPEARRVIADAVRRWGQIDIDAEHQANEIIRAYGSGVAEAALNKAYRKVGAKQRPWAYAWTVAQDGPACIPPKQANQAPQNQPGGPTEAELLKIREELAARPRESKAEFERRLQRGG